MGTSRVELLQQRERDRPNFRFQLTLRPRLSSASTTSGVTVNVHNNTVPWRHENIGRTIHSFFTSIQSFLLDYAIIFIEGNPVLCHLFPFPTRFVAVQQFIITIQPRWLIIMYIHNDIAIQDGLLFCFGNLNGWHEQERNYRLRFNGLKNVIFSRKTVLGGKPWEREETT